MFDTFLILLFGLLFPPCLEDVQCPRGSFAANLINIPPANHLHFCRETWLQKPCEGGIRLRFLCRWLHPATRTPLTAERFTMEEMVGALHWLLWQHILSGYKLVNTCFLAIWDAPLAGLSFLPQAMPSGGTINQPWIYLIQPYKPGMKHICFAMPFFLSSFLTAPLCSIRLCFKFLLLSPMSRHGIL